MLRPPYQGLRITTSLSRVLLTLGMAVCAVPAMANPDGGVVVGGSASVSSLDKTVTVTQQSDRAIVNWQSFNIDPDETTKFVQPSVDAIALNRVMTNDPSKIMGTLSANGKIVLVNPNGVFFGKDSVIDVGGIIASTADIADDKFMEGDLSFDKKGNANTAIVNQGTITAREAGLVGFVAPNVINQGTIIAKLGRVHLATGDTATVDLYGDGLMEVAVSDEVTSQALLNSGVIEANGGTIELTAAAGAKIVRGLIINSGVIQAQTEQEKTGSITLQAEGSNGTDKEGNSLVLNSGVIDASGRDSGERGGNITVTGDEVGLMNGTIIDASGDTGQSNTTDGKEISAVREGAAGGDIKIGGDYLGQGDTQRAKDLYVDAGALILNDAITQGDAGRTIFWSDGTTDFYGNVYARALGGKEVDADTWHASAGGNEGNGGFVETSGHNQLNAGGYVDLTSSIGEKGTYFLDPTNIAIYGNVDPAFTSTDASIDLATNLKLWLDAADETQVTLTYNPLGTTANGTTGATTITVSANTDLAVGARIRLGAAGAITTADTTGADTYTIASIDGTTITLTSALTGDYTGSAVYQGYVSSWLDKSGQGNAATQATASEMPLWISNGQNGLGRLDFSSGTAYLIVNAALNSISSAENSLFVTVQTASTVLERIVNAWNGNKSTWAIVNNSSSAGDTTVGNVAFLNRSGFWGPSDVVTSLSEGSMLGFTYDGSTVQPYQDSLALSSGVGSNATTTAINIGRFPAGFNAYTGNLFDVIAYSMALVPDAVYLLHQYQSAKWGIALTPPGTGATEVEKATASDGYSVFTSRYLERLSESANVSLQATNDITLDLQGDTINFATAGRSLSLTAGNTITTQSTGGITTNGGDINLSGVNGILFNHAMALNSQGGNITANAGNGAFVNQAGSDVFTVGDGRWLVYSSDPATDTRGGLVPDFKQYNASYGSEILGSDNGFVYSRAPLLSVSLVGNVAKVYDGTLTATLANNNFSVTGEIDGDAVTLTGVATYDTKNIGTGKTITAQLSVLSAQDSTSSVYGYGFTAPTITGALGTITSADLVLTANNVVRFVGRANPVLTASYQGLQTGDSAAIVQGLVLTTSADEFSAVGAYSITPSGASAANYTITYQNGTLTITSLPTTYIAQAQTIVMAQPFAFAPDVWEKTEKLQPPRRAKNPLREMARYVWIEMDPELKRILGYQ